MENVQKHNICATEPSYAYGFPFILHVLSLKSLKFIHPNKIISAESPNINDIQIKDLSNYKN
jgi:hypothetical protein